jgi:hypothetical protein
MTTPTTPGEWAMRAETGVLVLILLVVGGFAGAASFTHVKDWTMANSPHGTGQWFGWANAVISELIPIAALLVIRRRRRTGQSIRYPMGLLLAAVALSLSAQLAVAKPGISGWLLSAVPALAFMGLSKLVLTTDGPGRPASPAAVPSPQPSGAPSSSGTVQDRQDGGDGTGTVDADLLVRARAAADRHRQATGRDMTRDQLRAALRVSNATASELLRTVRGGDRRGGLVPVPADAFTRPPAAGSRSTSGGGQ